MAQPGNPRETVKASEAAINAGDLEAMVSLYEPDAMFISAPGRWPRVREPSARLLLVS